VRASARGGMCDDAAPGVCATGSFVAAMVMSSGMGLVSEMLVRVAGPGLTLGATFGTVAAAFPDGGPEVRAVLLILASAAAVGFASAALETNDTDTSFVFFIRASLTSAAASLALLCSGALERRPRYDIDAAHRAFLIDRTLHHKESSDRAS